jgi:hypothetical protein
VNVKEEKKDKAPKPPKAKKIKAEIISTEAEPVRIVAGVVNAAAN